MNNNNAQKFVNYIHQYMVKHITPIANGYVVEGYKFLAEAWRSKVVFRSLCQNFIGNSDVMKETSLSRKCPFHEVCLSAAIHR